MKELNLQRQCMLIASKHQLLCYHFEAINTQLPNGRYVRSGVPVGWPDLTIIDPRTSLTMFAELKVGRNTTTHEQDDFLALLPNAYLIRTTQEFIKALQVTFHL